MNHEAIYQALFALLTPLGVAFMGPFNTVSREIAEVQTFDPGLQPVLMQYEMDETFTRDPSPTTKALLECWLIIGTQTTKGTAGATVLNPLIDAVIAAIKAPIGQPRQTLGGLVHSVVLVQVIKDIGDNSKSQYRQAAASMKLEITVGLGP